MKKTFLFFVIAVILFLNGCSTVSDDYCVPQNEKINAVWIYYSELSMQDESGGTAESFGNKFSRMLDLCEKYGINTIFFQVRPFCDAFYKSDIFPWSVYLTGKQGRGVGYDPLKIAVSAAHSRGITLHAWINPFRISSSNDTSKLSENNPALGWIKEKSRNVVNVNGGWYFCPASPEAQRLVTDGVREIVNNYDVDGIHIDDYFYPSTDKSVDSVYYDEYKKNGGELSLKNWRLDTVSAFVSQLYAATKSVSGKCIFSISPAGNILNNYNEQYADVKLWCSRRGYADWIIPQLYYGFENEKLPFSLACNVWSALPLSDSVKMIYGIGAYRINDSDEEWQAGSGIIKKQLDMCREKDNYSGAAFFSYSSLADSANAAEFKNLSSPVSAETRSENG